LLSWDDQRQIDEVVIQWPTEVNRHSKFAQQQQQQQNVCISETHDIFPAHCGKECVLPTRKSILAGPLHVRFCISFLEFCGLHWFSSGFRLAMREISTIGNVQSLKFLKMFNFQNVQIFKMFRFSKKKCSFFKTAHILK
jgi:hypothetical protein